MCDPSFETCGGRLVRVLVLTAWSLWPGSLGAGIAWAQDPFEEVAEGQEVAAGSKELPSPMVLEDVRTRAQQHTLKRLRENISLQFVETPLSQAMDAIGNQTRLTVMLDRLALDAAGIDSSTPICMQFRVLPLESALALGLRQAELTFLVRDGVIVVTTSDEAEMRPMTQVFCLRGLIGSDAPVEATSAMIDLLSTSVAPDSWERNGGTGMLVAYQGILVATNTYGVLRDVESLLEQLRQQLVASGGLQPWPKSGYSRGSLEAPEPQEAVRGGTGVF